METLARSVADELRGLRTSTPEIIGAVVIKMDGFVVSSVMEQVYVSSPTGHVIINAITPESALVLLVTRDAKLGLIFLELKRAIGELARLI